MTRFQALELSLDVITSLRQPVATIGRKDRKLADEIRRAASSVALNLAEGRRRSGRDRLHHWRIASGSADEVRTALRVAQAWGDVDARTAGESLELLDRLLAMLWRLTR